jgi:hypothetical protein
MMELKGSELIRAKRDEVFAFVTDAQNFSRGIPDVQRIEILGPERFKVVARLGISVIRTEFDVLFEVSEKTTPSHVKLRGHGLGGGSAVDLKMAIDFGEEGRSTKLDWTATATVSGALASLGQRVLGAAADRLVKEIFESVHRYLETSAPEKSAKD